MSTPILRIGVFYDGNYFFHVSNYYNYVHAIRRRISINGLHRFICEYLSLQEKVDLPYCRIIDAHYFRGRLSSYDADQANRLLAERAFEDILMSERVITHYLPLRIIDGRREEKGIDTWLALEAFELAIHKKFDVVVLIACDGDYVPLARKLNALGTRVMVLGWDFEYRDSRNDRLHTTITSVDLLGEVTYPLAMHDLIDNLPNTRMFDLDDLFVPKEPATSSPPRPKADDREEGNILSLKDGYGFIFKPPNNLFFHWTDVINPDFNDLRINDRVEYTISQNDKGQEIAIEVKRM